MYENTTWGTQIQFIWQQHGLECNKNGARINYTPWGTRADLRNESEPSKKAHRRGELR